MTEDYINKTLTLIDELSADESRYLHPDLARSIRHQLLAVKKAFQNTGDNSSMPKDLTLGLIAIRELEPRGYEQLANRICTLNHYVNTGEFCP